MTAPDERIQGPVDSPMTQLLNHMEVSMWAEGIDPEVAIRVLNRITFGHPSGGGHGTVKGLPQWANESARMYLAEIQADLAESGGPVDENGGHPLRLVLLAMVQRALQERGSAERALSE